jgi:hypothetical protein
MHGKEAATEVSRSCIHCNPIMFIMCACLCLYPASPPLNYYFSLCARRPTRANKKANYMIITVTRRAYSQRQLIARTDTPKKERERERERARAGSVWNCSFELSSLVHFFLLLLATMSRSITRNFLQ